MSITATELKNNLGKYLEIAKTEKVYITQYGKVIVVLSNPQDSKLEDLNTMKGKFRPVSEDEADKARYKRLSAKCGL